MNKKGFTLIELVSILALLAVIAVISFRTITKRIRSSQQKLYEVLISDIEKAGEKYMLKHNEVDKYHLDTLCISIETLKEDNLLKKDVIKHPRTHEELNGYVKIQYDDTKKQYTYQYSDSCTTIEVTPIIETILTKENVKVTSNGDGLYETTDSYVYRGENPNNYIKINGILWRIIDIDKTTNMVKIINLSDNQQQYPEKGIIDYLNNDYANGTTYESLEQLINPNSKWNTGKVEKLDTALSIKSNEKQSSDYNTVGLLSVGEYIDASLDKNCYSSNDCSSYLTTGKKYWLINKIDDIKEWYIDDDSIKNITIPTTQMLHVYPVVYLKINTSVKGSGTELDPYIIK